MCESRFPNIGLGAGRAPGQTKLLWNPSLFTWAGRDAFRSLRGLGAPRPSSSLLFSFCEGYFPINLLFSQLRSLDTTILRILFPAIPMPLPTPPSSHQPSPPSLGLHRGVAQHVSQQPGCITLGRLKSFIGTLSTHVEKVEGLHDGSISWLRETARPVLIIPQILAE